jgi:FlaA1/EpsC-like NDP-sugar epimerase
MSATEAVALVLRASMLGASGDVFVLEIGDPHPIMELARRMIAGSGSGLPIEIELTGPRPGEKIEEDYRHGQCDLQPTSSCHILRASLPDIDPARARAQIAAILESAARGADADVIRHLTEIVPEYRPTPSAGAPEGGQSPAGDPDRVGGGLIE